MYCNFTSLLPIPENILPLCNQKPLDIINLTDSREEIIKKLKESGINYSLDSFLRMLQIISRNNIIHIDIDNTLVSSLRKLLGLLEEFKAEEEEVVPPSLTDLFLNVMDTFDIGSTSSELTKEVKDLNNFLIKQIESMKRDLLDFLRKNSGKDVTRKKMNEVNTFINTLSDWSAYASQSQGQTIKNNNSIYNFTHFF